MISIRLNLKKLISIVTMKVFFQQGRLRTKVNTYHLMKNSKFIKNTQEGNLRNKQRRRYLKEIIQIKIFIFINITPGSILKEVLIMIKGKIAPKIQLLF